MLLKILKITERIELPSRTPRDPGLGNNALVKFYFLKHTAALLTVRHAPLNTTQNPLIQTSNHLDM
jgi:hypothetical protein